MAGGVPFAKNCGHCAKLVGCGVSKAALSKCGERAQERCGLTLTRDMTNAVARRPRCDQENRRFTDVGGKKNGARLKHFPTCKNQRHLTTESLQRDHTRHDYLTDRTRSPSQSEYSSAGKHQIRKKVPRRTEPR